MNENLNFESYFGTPVYAVELPELVKNLIKKLETLVYLITLNL